MDLDVLIRETSIENLWLDNRSIKPILNGTLAIHVRENIKFEFYDFEGTVSTQNLLIGFIHRKPNQRSIEFNTAQQPSRNSKILVEFYIELDDYLSLKIEEHRRGEDVRFEFEIFIHLLTENDQGGHAPILRTAKRSISKTIAKSEWIKNYYPILFSKKKILLEFDSLNDRKISSKSFEIIKSKLDKSDRHFKNGDYEEAFETAREAIEVFYTKNDIKSSFKKLLIKYKHGEDSINELDVAIKNIFHFLSKPLHTMDKNNEIKPDADYRKEDAEFAYAFAYTLANMYHQKLNRG